MDKMSMESVDLTQKNVERIYELFPSVVTEKRGEDGKLKKAVNFELLKQILADEVVEGDEVYEFTWVGKKEAIAEAGRPIRKTLRPCKEESKNWDTTENLYIEGDNLDVLKLLQESYLGQIKMIYIDPPYNTGKDFVYRDNFNQKRGEYEENLGVFDESGNRLFQNTETNGRFHSDWCSMLYPRLQLAKNLLSDNGVIFISIDDSEIKNLRNICDEIYGETNFITQLIWQNKKGGGNDSTHIAVEHEYIVVYAKNKFLLNEFYEAYSDDYAARYREQDENGKFYWDTFKRKSGKQYYPITCPDGTVLENDTDGNPISWLRSKDRFLSDIKTGEIRIVKNKDNWSVQFKQRMPKGKKPRSIFKTESLVDAQGTTSDGANDVYKYFKKDVFSNPKPVKLLEFLLGFGLNDDGIVLDFFSGSASIAEAVMNLNKEDNGKRKYIAVQLQENINPMLSSSSANAKRVARNAIDFLSELEKPPFITEIAKIRIDRAGDAIVENGKSVIDIGFRVFQLDDSNMKDVYYSAEEYTQATLDEFLSNIKEDRTDLDLLYGCLLEWGLPLSLPYSSEEYRGATIHTVNEGDLIACFDSEIIEEVVREIAKRQPLRVVFRDSSFENSPAKINVEEIFKLLAPNTRVKVI